MYKRYKLQQSFKSFNNLISKNTSISTALFKDNKAHLKKRY
jgi:hypothetical protein